MNHAGEIEPLSRLARPHVAIITTIAPVHLEFFGSLAKIADAKAEIFLGLEAGGAAVLNRDNSQFAHLQTPRQGSGRRAHRVVRRARKGRRAPDQERRCTPTARPSRRKFSAPSSPIRSARRAAISSTIRWRCWRRPCWSAPIWRWRRWRSPNSSPLSGRGAAIEIDLPGGPALVIDDSYNANPASVDAALALLGQAPIGPRGRRIAVLGDMLELGPRGRALHRGLLDAVVANAVDLVFCCGPLMRALWQALPASRRGGYAEDSAALEAQVLSAIRAGDVVMVKGSLGSRMAPIVKALQRLSTRPGLVGKRRLRNRVRTRLMRCSIGWSICRTR